ncbi:MAG: glutamyl-tRNA reductase [archaeon]|nr:glutamyl-tRNA reductase [archaeon]
MLMSLHVTHSSAGLDTIADVMPIVENGAKKFICSTALIKEYIILRTCNRFEIYLSTDSPEQMKLLLEGYARREIPFAGSSVIWYILMDMACVRHLFRVTCGLDSLMVGEDQIQNQVKNAYLKAKEEGHISGVMGMVFEKALYTGKKVRTETRLNVGAISVGSAAVQLAERKLGGLSGKVVAIVGAGDMATVIAKNLKGKNLNSIFVSNRTFDHAKVLANEIGGRAVNFCNVAKVLRKSDLVIVATNAPHILINKDIAEEGMKGRSSKLLIIDISVPRNVSDDLNELKNVEVDSIGDINAIAQENLSNRRNEIVSAERIVDSEIKNIDTEMKERKVSAIIASILSMSSEVCLRETNFAKSRVRGGADVNEVIDGLSHALVSKLFARLFDKLKEASRSGHMDICDVAANLFEVDNK